MVIVPDDDLIKLLSEFSQDVTKPLGRILNHIMTEFDRTISVFKELLPLKCLRTAYPHMLWIQAPLHDGFNNNSQRFKFNRALEDVVKFHENMSTLFLKKGWNAEDSLLYSSEVQRFTSTGYKMYWEAVDHTIWFCDSIVLKKQNDKRKALKPQGQKDLFRWKNPTYNPGP